MTETLLNTALEDNQLRLETDAIDRLQAYLDLLNRWNAVYNLTAITDPRAQIYKHLIDSLIISPLLHGNHCLDIGTGPGLPGIPLAIANPDKHFVLLDCNQKKTRFLVQAKAALGLTNSEIVHQRVETYAPTQPFSTILSRAFSAIDPFLAVSQHLIAPEGQWLAMKGQHPDQELNKISEDFVLKDVRQFEIKGLDANRHVAILTKR